MPTEKQCYVELEFSEFPASESQVSTICLEACLFEWLFFLCIDLVAKMFGSQLILAHIHKAKELSTCKFGSFQAYLFFSTEENKSKSDKAGLSSLLLDGTIFKHWELSFDILNLISRKQWRRLLQQLVKVIPGKMPNCLATLKLPHHYQ